jgi:hypothetical protein
MSREVFTWRDWCLLEVLFLAMAWGLLLGWFALLLLAPWWCAVGLMAPTGWAAQGLVAAAIGCQAMRGPRAGPV